MELTPRLRAVAELVPRGARLADIGTDHAYLPVYLLQRGVIGHAIAADLRPGPLERARQTGERCGMAERMEFRLCDGLGGVRPHEADTITIAGMGGETIAHILAAAPWTKEGGVRLILQPMSSISDLRGWLWGHGYRILKERLVQEGSTFYTILLAEGGRADGFTLAEQWAGRQHRGMDSPLRTRLLDDLLRRARRAAQGLRRSTRAEDIPRLAQMEHLAEELEQMKEEWLQWHV